MGEVELERIAESDAALRDLRMRGGDEDPNAELMAWVHAQLLLIRFKNTLDPVDGRESVQLFRMCSGGWIAEQFRLYEVARAHYEVGKRLQDIAMIETAAASYVASAEHANRFSRFSRRTGKNATEAREVARALRARRVVPAGTAVTPVTLAVPMITLSLENDCVHMSRRWRSDEPNHFDTSIAGRACLIRFIVSDESHLDRLFSPPPDVEHRGRGAFGPMQFAVAIRGQQSNVAVLEFAFPDDGEGAKAFFEENFEAVQGWGARFSKWFDVVYPQGPLHGVTNVTRNLQVQVGAGRGMRSVRVLAPDAKSHVLLNSVDLDRCDRVHLQQVIDELAHLDIPIALDFIRRARATMSAGDLLRALMECGTAAEAALAAQYDYLATSSHGPRWTLGRLIIEAEKIPGALPPGVPRAVFSADLVQVRNRAIHSGHTDEDQAEGALELAELIVEHVYALDLEDVAALRDAVRQLHP
ncbi:hypothetical protein L2K70_16990 [Nocardioides KLBMP 9356]|uniref:Apea-like HEPN domain-containing protein n=1 Tax=Nocardioides potassii TaxID=2911371 RepID=A0ABS9HGG8_9ACTN|nr:hypothetical protein [Nocardioides potassii]MCF6379310.1 hypothetical protein [Nocardioides potassii]